MAILSLSGNFQGNQGASGLQVRVMGTEVTASVTAGLCPVPQGFGDPLEVEVPSGVWRWQRLAAPGDEEVPSLGKGETKGKLPQSRGRNLSLILHSSLGLCARRAGSVPGARSKGGILALPSPSQKVSFPNRAGAASFLLWSRDCGSFPELTAVRRQRQRGCGKWDLSACSGL